MEMRIAVFYGSYRQDRNGIAYAQYLARSFTDSGDSVDLIDAQEIDLPMLDRMYKEYPDGKAPEAMEKVASVIRDADGFVFVTGEYNWGVQPGLKNLTDHFLEEWFWRPAAIACYSAGPFAGVRAMMHWRAILGEMGMVVTSTPLALGGVHKAFDETGAPNGTDGERLVRNFPKFADDLKWWAEAAKAQRAKKDPPY
ncbi:NADPH-dependent FMN reductase [Sphingorhabdus sp. SMR4y]|uniref:NADPH-dependent FMN reductase n=1 Tax=Sphingorhabdus sp. SMR4y TaxID=2584094 RepID=UPI000B5C7DFE|nr:NADPH-dependent FMN reductase [Sphingorhabdus sp. SMR4y]